MRLLVMWTREVCAAMERAGKLAPRRYEMIGGELVRKARKSRGRMVAGLLHGEWLQRLYGCFAVPVDRCASLGESNE